MGADQADEPPQVVLANLVEEPSSEQRNQTLTPCFLGDRSTGENSKLFFSSIRQSASPAVSCATCKCRVSNIACNALPDSRPTASADAQEAECTGRQAEVEQLDERIATLQFNEQSQYAAISALESSLDSKHTHLANLEARIAELEARGDPDLATLREMSQKQVDIASTLRKLISDNQEQAQARARIIESQRQQLTARHRRNLLKQVDNVFAIVGQALLTACYESKWA